MAPLAGVALDLLYNVVNDQHVAQEAALWRRAILLSSVGGVISAAFILFLARRKRLGLAAVGLWTVLAVLAGPAGILLLICLRGLPITIRCAPVRAFAPHQRGALPPLRRGPGDAGAPGHGNFQRVPRRCRMTTLSTSAAHPAPADFPPAPRPVPPSAGAVWPAMFFKEARELAVPAALIVAGYGLVLAMQLYTASTNVIQSGINYANAGWVLIDETTVLAAALAASILGFVQFITESRGDRFGFLAHRPVLRGRLFACKVAAGLGLYLLALGVPAFFALGWISNPRNMPLPFTWSMGLAPLADILSGILFLVAQRSDSRWHGVALSPLVVPVAASLTSDQL